MASLRFSQFCELHGLASWIPNPPNSYGAPLQIRKPSAGLIRGGLTFSHDPFRCRSGRIPFRNPPCPVGRLARASALTLDAIENIRCKRHLVHRDFAVVVLKCCRGCDHGAERLVCARHATPKPFLITFHMPQCPPV